MDSSVIKEFLVSLGYEVDASQERRFVDGIVTATKVVASLAAGLGAMVAATAAAANEMEKLWFIANRTNTAVQNIKAMQYAMADLGSSAEGAVNAIEGVARFMRNNPGGEAWIKNLGIDTRDANGGLRDTAEIIGDLGKQFAAMPYYLAERRASLLGIDEKTLQALIKGVGQFSEEYKRAANAIGFDQERAAKTSHEFMVQLRGLWSVIDMVGTKYLTEFGEKLIPLLARARGWIETHSAAIGEAIDRVTNVLGAFGKVIYTVIERAVEIFGRMVEVYRNLNPQTREIVNWIAALTAGVIVLNRVLAASPITWVLMLAAALLLLYDDYKTWKEGGQSLIDWDKWGPAIDLAEKGIHAITSAIRGLIHAYEDWVNKSSPTKTAVGGFLQKTMAFFGYGDAEDAQRQQEFSDLGEEGRKKALAAFRAMSPEEKAALSPGYRTQLERYENSQVHGPNGSTNNPGNIRSGPGGTFGSYQDANAGLSAIGRQLSLYYTGASRAAGGRHLDTIRDIISTYAPPSENNTEAYISDVSQRTGAAAGAKLNLSDPETMAALIRGIVIHEQGRNPYSNEQYRQAAQNVLGGGVNQTTTINVNGAGDPQAVGTKVLKGQTEVNQKMARNLQPAAS